MHQARPTALRQFASMALATAGLVPENQLRWAPEHRGLRRGLEAS